MSLSTEERALAIKFEQCEKRKEKEHLAALADTSVARLHNLWARYLEEQAKR